MSALEQGMGLALAGLRRVASSELVDRFGQRERLERVVRTGVRQGFGAATTAARGYKKMTPTRSHAVRQEPRAPKLFDLNPSDEQQMLVEMFDQVATEVLRPAGRVADDNASAPDEVLAQLSELGLLSLGVPSELGGVLDERSTVLSVLAASSLAHGDPGLTVAALAPAAVANLLSLYGTAAQQERWLTAFTGEDAPVASFAMMEPRALFDPTALRTTATRSDDGFVLEGLKSMVARVGDAELFVVAAELEGAPALFMVEGGAAGLTQRIEPTMGARAAAFGELQLAGVQVDAGALIGDASAELYSEVIARSRIAWCAVAVGAAQATLDLLIPYVKERHAFGEPISHRQAVAFAISDMAIELEGMRLATWRAASLADQGKPFAEAAAIARQLVATHGKNIGSNGVQLLGGHGFVKEYPVERWYRDLTGAGLAEGILVV
ncbi:MAG: alkylation response protein AidB-like acyl-CoA dehydrogenase [Myxococcota bacterium]